MALLPIGPQEIQETMLDEREASLHPDEDAYEAAEFFDRDPASPEAAPEVEPGPEFPVSGHSAGPAPQAESESMSLPLTIDDFAALEERVLRAVSLVRRERLARSVAEERAVKAETQLREHTAQLEKLNQLQQEVDALRQEREQVRQRVERLLSQLDALEL